MSWYWSPRIHFQVSKVLTASPNMQLQREQNNIQKEQQIISKMFFVFWAANSQLSCRVTSVTLLFKGHNLVSSGHQVYSLLTVSLRCDQISAHVLKKQKQLLHSEGISHYYSAGSSRSGRISATTATQALAGTISLSVEQLHSKQPENQDHQETRLSPTSVPQISSHTCEACSTMQRSSKEPSTHT